MALDYRVRAENDPQQYLRQMHDQRQAALWTALPGIIQSFNAVAMTVSVQPAIQSTYTGPDQVPRTVNLPVLPDVPVVFPHGGGYNLTFPIEPGDECLVVFASRCIDNWWAQGGIGNQREYRMHDLSDGFALVGPYSQKRTIANVSTTAVQLRSDDGQRYVEINESNVVIVVGGSGGVTATVTPDSIDVVAPAEIKLDTPAIRCTGNLSVGHGASGVFTSATGQIVTVQDGIITNIF